MYQPPDKKIWTGRTDPNEGGAGLRWHQCIELIDLSDNQLPSLKTGAPGVVILGFKSDEGVRRNQGRTGAKDGPEALRKACCNHASHFKENTLVLDGGNIICDGQDLETAQAELSGCISKIAAAHYFPLVFGGGHEVAYPHYSGLSRALSNEKTIGIINIDAHFDLRIPDDQSSSGTPFYEISVDCGQRSAPFNYLCIGVQQSSNTRALFKRADKLGVTYISADEIMLGDAEKHLEKLTGFINAVDCIYLTVCLDVFDISFAPGVSAPTSTGLTPAVVLGILKKIVGSGKLVAADVAELNPSLDLHGTTAKLAAKIVYFMITPP
ncbi:MAG: formimidoylglutamase [Cytophagales bacterium]|nr:formimidoylglutamase [Cytophagales bacterium]